MNDFLMMNDLERAAQAKAMVMAYPHYSDEIRTALLDSIDAMLDCQRTSMKNAKEALDDAFNKNYIPCK